MPITNFPINTKYAPGDTVYTYSGGRILSLIVSGWEVEVSNPSGDGVTAKQINLYDFVGQGNLQIREKDLYSSRNHVKGTLLRGDYFNRAIESGSGGHSIFSRMHPKADRARLNLQSWTDFAGWEMIIGGFNPGEIYIGVGTVDTTSGSAIISGTNTEFLTEFQPGDSIIIEDTTTKIILSITSDVLMTCTTNVGANYSGAVYNSLNYIPVIWQTSELIFDGADLTGATLPTNMDTIAEFKAAIKSYDKDTTTFTNGYPARQFDALDTVTLTDLSAIITGGGSSAFVANIKVGDDIVIPAQSSIVSNIRRTVISVDSNTQITVNAVLDITSPTLAGKSMIIIPKIEDVS